MSFTKKQWLVSIGWLLVLGVLFVTPALWYGTWGLDGTDDAAAELVGTIQAGFEPWIEPWWEPSLFGENLLFMVQGAIGIGFLIYYGRTLKKAKRVSK